MDRGSAQKTPILRSDGAHGDPNRPARINPRRKRSLAGVDVPYLSVDGMHLKLDPERDREQPVLLAYEILWDGRKVLLHVDVGGRESYEACRVR